MAGNLRIWTAIVVVWVVFATRLHAAEIHLQSLRMESPLPGEMHIEKLLPNEIAGVEAEHVALTGPLMHTERLSRGCDSVLLFIKGSGRLHAGGKSQIIEPETIALPISFTSVRIEVSGGDTLHYVRIRKLHSPEDLVDAQGLVPRNRSGIYVSKFSDCRAYTEKIKSPKTVSRTVLPKNYAPRLAMGTVETTGPDAVGAHEHPMLDQLFLGLADNESIVYADDAKVQFPAFSLLHIPLGSRHWVEVEDGRHMYYMWMDFFLTKEGLEWLKTHKHVERSQPPDVQSTSTDAPR